MTIYQEELKRRLKEQGYGAVYDEESEMLKIYHNGVFLCDQGKNGELVYDSKIINGRQYSQFTQKIFEEASEIKECARLYENGMPMKVESVSNYHKFLEYGDTVLAGAYNKNRGFQFATWWQNDGGSYLAYGHYTDNFTKAKEDFTCITICRVLPIQQEMAAMRATPTFCPSILPTPIQTVKVLPPTPIAVITVSFLRAHCITSMTPRIRAEIIRKTMSIPTTGSV